MPKQYRQHDPALRAALAVILLGTTILAGCATLSQDLDDFAKKLSPPSPGEAARMAVDPNDPDQRREGILLLSGATFGGDPEYVALYRDYAANEPNALVRSVSVRALAKHGSPELDAPLIAEQLTYDDYLVRWEAAKGLQRLHNPVAVKALLDAVGDPDEHNETRVAAATALGQYPEDRVVQTLVAGLDAQDLVVNVACQRSLETLTGQAFGLDARAWLEWYDEQGATAFADQRDFLYPTYQRQIAWYEKMAFWVNRDFEQPAPPAGLGAGQARRTYADSDDETPAADEPALQPATDL